MLKALLLSFQLVLAGMAMAQNLVPNPSFEGTTDCDQYPAGDYEFMLGLARPWFSPNRATPDIYDCDLDRSCGQPMDPEDLQGVVAQGFQLAYHGDRMAAALQWFGPDVPPDQDTREYLMVRLLAPLEGDRSYAVSLFYSRAEGYGLAVDRLGVYFSPDSVSADDPVVLPLEPQVILRDPSNTYLTVGEEWVQLVDTFIANGGEEWMIIGTFDGSDAVNGVDLLPGSGSNYAYYYIDQVAVVPIGPPQGIHELIAWTNGQGGVNLRWTGLGSLETVYIFDSVGKLVYTSMPFWTVGQYALQTNRTLASGVYSLVGTTGKSRWVTRLVVEEGVR